MGRPKGLLDLGGVPLLRAHVDAFTAAGLPVTVVLGPAVAAHLAVLPPGVDVVLNLAWARTEMADSAAMGLEGLGDALVTPVDAPPARADTLACLCAAHGAAVPTWQGQPGHPVRVTAPHRRAPLSERLADATPIPVDDPDCTLNLNRPEEWAAWLRTRPETKHPRCR
jgi:CTP:molybdopterin cytidylyltransferase MocA